MQIQTLADIEVFEQTPAESRWRGDNTYELLANSAKKFPDDPALKFQFTAELDEMPTVITYKEFLENIHRVANALASNGVSHGGVTSVIMPNLPETHYALWGAQALGITGPINSLLEPIALRDIMKESGTEALVILGPTEGENLWEKAESIVDEVPSLTVVLRVMIDKPSEELPQKTPGGIPIVDFHAAIESESGETLTFDRDIPSDDIAAYFHTGGTTGTPKIAQLRHSNQVHVASMMADYRRMDTNTSTFGGLPLFHVNAYFNAGLTIFAAGGHAIYLTRSGFRNKEVMANYWALVEKYRPQFLMTVPTMVTSLLDNLSDETDLSSIQYFVCGAAPISPDLFRRFQDMTGINIIEAYGLTEGTVTSSANPRDGEKKVGSIGLRSPYQEMKCVILDDDGQYVRDCKVEEPGCIVIRGPNIFAGYKQQDKNTGAFIDDWFVTGDLARQDADGYFWMTGRAKDLIIRGGHNIDPKTIEDAYATHPDLDLVAAIGQPDAYAGELPCVYVTLSDQAAINPPTMDELIAFGKANIPERAAAPAYLEVLGDMPVTAVGKIFKPTLREMAAERVLRNELTQISPDIMIKVQKDERRGMLAKVTLPSGTNLKQNAEQALGQFTVPYEIT